MLMAFGVKLVYYLFIVLTSKKLYCFWCKVGVKFCTFFDADKFKIDKFAAKTNYEKDYADIIVNASFGYFQQCQRREYC